jgi:pyrroloquinoline quinone (PQQ) biosynthesis protein C
MLAVTDSQPLSREALAEALLGAVKPYRFEDTRFHAILAKGPAPPRILARFACGTYALATQFVGMLATMVATAPDPHARLLLLENLLEEEGIVLKPSRGLAVRPAARHVNLARRFVAACGVNPDTVELERWPAQAMNRARTLIAQDRWVEATAYLLIGNELKAGEACPAIVELLIAQGFAERDVAFFEVHIEADQSHGQEAVAMVCDAATDRKTQEAAIRAAGDGARAWFDNYGGRAG